jgi:tetratricopeptide (TPR) repeat protein
MAGHGDSGVGFAAVTAPVEPTDPLASPRSSRRARAICIAVLAVLSFAQYAYTLRNDFVWDARAVFLDDPSVREWRFASTALTEEFFANLTIEESGVAGLRYYRPLVKLIHIAEFQLFGTDPTGYNAVNVLTNAVVVVLAFLAVLSIGGSVLVAFLSALLYAVNPLRVEAVAWAYSDSYLFAAALGMGALLAHRQGRRVAAVALFALSLLCHESAILLAVVIPLHDRIVVAATAREVLRRAVPYLAAAALYLVVRRIVVGAIPLPPANVAAFLMTAVVITARSVKIFFVPDAPVAMYESRSFTLTSEVAISAIVVAALVALAFAIRRAGRQHLFWYLWFFAWMAVALNAGRYGAFLMAEKLLFVACLGPATLLALAASGAATRYRPAAVAAVCALAALHAGIAYSRLPHWRSTRALLEQARAFAPGFSLLRYTLGDVYAADRLHDLAIREYEATVQLVPGHSHAYTNMGNVYLEKREIPKAVLAWQQAVRADPANPEPYYNLGIAREIAGDVDGALSLYGRYLSLATSPPPAVVEHVQQLRAARLSR